MFKKILKGLFASDVATTSDDAGSWSLGSGNDNGKPLIIRYLSRLPNAFDKTKFPVLMAITWTYESSNGMPPQSEKSRMNELEDALTEAVEKNGAAILTALVTGNNTFEMQFYTQSEKLFVDLLNKALLGKPAFPIQIIPQSDHEWFAYKRFADLKK